MKTVQEMAAEAGISSGHDGGTGVRIGYPSDQIIRHLVMADLERFAALVRDQALEEAALLADPWDDFGEKGGVIAQRIRALKVGSDTLKGE